jgi:hypothetical protein
MTQVPNPPTDEEIIIRPETGITQAQMDEYAAIVNKYLDKIETAEDGKRTITWKSYDLTPAETDALYPLYIQMTKEQRKQQFIMVQSPLNPMKLRSPNNHEWNVCLSREKIWIDGKLTTLEDAKAYGRRSIVAFFLTARDPHIGSKTYMWTRTGHEAFINQYGKQITLAKLREFPPQFWFASGRPPLDKAVTKDAN